MVLHQPPRLDELNFFLSSPHLLAFNAKRLRELLTRFGSQSLEVCCFLFVGFRLLLEFFGGFCFFVLEILEKSVCLFLGLLLRHDLEAKVLRQLEVLPNFLVEVNDIFGVVENQSSEDVVGLRTSCGHLLGLVEDVSVLPLERFLGVWVADLGNELLNVLHVGLEWLDIVRSALMFKSLNHQLIHLDKVVISCLSEVEA